MDQTVNILVIDDELGMREGCRRALTPYGYVVDVAENGAEGLGKVRTGRFDLVLLDVMMPGVSGVDLIAPIHQHDPEIVCVIITGYATVEMAVRAMKQGAYDFIAKPFTSDDLLLVVNRGVERRRLALEARRLQTIEADAHRLIEEKARLEEVDEAKSLFIRQVTHELRAPVGAVLSYLRLILEGYVPPEREREILEKSEVRAREVLNLIDDLLELSRLREMKLRAAPGLVQLDEVARTVVEEFEGEAFEKGVRLKVDIARNLPPVLGIAEQFKSVWTNLIGNAIKYTPGGGCVEIRLHLAGGVVEGRVRDTGIGIPPDAEARLFTEFFRAENAKAATRHGTGLGLAIVKRILDDAGGHIQVESEPGEGTTFIFGVPAYVEKPAATGRG